MAERSEPGEEAGVRGTGQRHVRYRGREAHAARGQAVESGRRRLRAAVAADMVGTKGVDGDEQDARVRHARSARLRPGRGRRATAAREQERDEGRGKEAAMAHPVAFESVQKPGALLNPWENREKGLTRTKGKV